MLLTLGELWISRSTILDATALANGLVLDASGNDPTPDADDGLGSRIFRIDDGDPVADSPVTIRGLTLTGGDVNGEGGAVLAREPLTLESSVIRGNSGGAGIVASGDVTANASTISENTGSGISARGSVAISFSYVSGNSGDGLNGASDVIVDSTIVSGNTGSGVSAGGNVAVSASKIDENTGHGVSASGDATIISSTIAGNRGRGVSSGRSVAVTSSTISGNLEGGIDAPDSVTVASSTISGNSARSGSGGGIYARGSVTVTSSTISGNTARDSGGGIQIAPSAAVSITDSIVAANRAASSRDLAIGSSSSGLTVKHSLIGDKGNTRLQEAPLGNPDANGNLIGVRGSHDRSTTRAIEGQRRANLDARTAAG